MPNYCGAAQVAFTYKTETPANAGQTKEQKVLATVVAVVNNNDVNEWVSSIYRLIY